MTALPKVFPTVVHMLDEAARLAPRREALVCGDIRLSYAAYRGAVAATAARLQAAGASGGRVALLMPNSADLAVGLLAAMAAGGQATPLNPAYTSHELGPILRDAAPKVIITVSAEAQKVHDALTGGPEVTIWALGGDQPNLIDGADHGAALPLPNADDPGILQYTSGTTGRPKGVELSHRAIAMNVSQREALVPSRRDTERTLLMTPLYHVYATSMCLYQSLFARGALVILPRYTPELALAAISQERISFLAGSPTIYHGLLASPALSETDFSKLSVCFSGASALPAETLRRWREVTGTNICEGFGQTEAGPVLAANPLGTAPRYGSVGLPLPLTEVVIIDLATGAPLPPGQSGEIRARGPQLMTGYRNAPEETAAALQDGWLCTGDIGHIDETGYLYVTGRKKEMVNVSGFNVFPREVEEALYTHPSVMEVAAWGVPHPHKGEALHCAAVLNTNASATVEQLLAHVAERLVRYKVPSQLWLLSKLPKTPIGKIDKAALKLSLSKDH